MFDRLLNYINILSIQTAKGSCEENSISNASLIPAILNSLMMASEEFIK